MATLEVVVAAAEVLVIAVATETSVLVVAVEYVVESTDH